MSPNAANPQRATIKYEMISVPPGVSWKVLPAKIICGISKSGTTLIARSVLGAMAETIKPIIKPPREVSTSEIYISRKAGRMMPLSG